jgi:hypothetical protein
VHGAYRITPAERRVVEFFWVIRYGSAGVAERSLVMITGRTSQAGDRRGHDDGTATRHEHANATTSDNASEISKRSWERQSPE